MNPTPEQISSVNQLILAMAEVIRTAGPIPSGELYARVMGKLSLDNYNSVISVLKRAKLVDERAHLLTWIGPQK